MTHVRLMIRSFRFADLVQCFTLNSHRQVCKESDERSSSVTARRGRRAIAQFQAINTAST